MVSLGSHIIESYAHLLNVDKSILKLNGKLNEFGYEFLCVDATEIEKNYSDLLSIPKSNERLLTIHIGRNDHTISHELHNSMVHNPAFGDRFMHLEFPEIILLRKKSGFVYDGGVNDIVEENKEFASFDSFLKSLLLQLRLYKRGEIRCSQYFQMTTETREVSMRMHSISPTSRGDYVLSDTEAEELSQTLAYNFEINELTELAIKNFSLVYDIPDGRIRIITLMTCLESLFNLGKDQIAHTIARHLGIILSGNREEFKENYARVKKLYNIRNAIVHGSEYKGDLMEDYLDLSDKVKKAIMHCNKQGLTKQILFDELNIKGYL